MDFRWSDAVKSTYKDRIHCAKTTVNNVLSSHNTTNITNLRHEAQKLAGTASLFGDIHVETAGYDLDQFLQTHPEPNFNREFVSFAEQFRDALEGSKYM